MGHTQPNHWFPRWCIWKGWRFAKNAAQNMERATGTQLTERDVELLAESFRKAFRLGHDQRKPD